MSYGWAWEDPSDPDSGYLRNRKLLVFTTAGASRELLAKRKYDEAFHTQLNVGTWNYCNFKDVTTRIFYDLDGRAAPSLCEDYLKEAEYLAKQVFS